MSKQSNVIAQTDRQTDRQTYLPAGFVSYNKTTAKEFFKLNISRQTVHQMHAILVRIFLTEIFPLVTFLWCVAWIWYLYIDTLLLFQLR